MIHIRQGLALALNELRQQRMQRRNGCRRHTSLHSPMISWEESTVETVLCLNWQTFGTQLTWLVILSEAGKSIRYPHRMRRGRDGHWVVGRS